MAKPAAKPARKTRAVAEFEAAKPVKGKGEAAAPPLPRPGELIWVDIVRNTLNPRTAFSEEYLEELAESIASQGLKTPIVVLATPAPDGRRVLEDGECRFRAIGLLIERGDERWPADRPIPHTVSDAANDTDFIVNALITGIQKQTLSWGDKASAFLDLIDNRGLSTLQVAQAIGGESRQRYVQQAVQMWRELDDDDKAKSRLPEGADGALSWTQARHQVQRKEDSQLKLDPKSMLLLYEIADHIERHKVSRDRLRAYVNNDIAEVADGAGGPEYDLLHAASHVQIHARKGQDGRSYIQLGSGWGSGPAYSMKATIPAWTNTKARADVLDQLRRAALGDADADACRAEKRYSVPWLNGPFTIPETLAAARAKTEAKKVAATKKAEEKAVADTERRRLTIKRAIEIGKDRTARAEVLFETEVKDTWAPLPWRLGSWGGTIVDANGAHAMTVGHSDQDRARAALIVVAMNHRAFLTTEQLLPADAGGSSLDRGLNDKVCGAKNGPADGRVVGPCAHDLKGGETLIADAGFECLTDGQKVVVETDTGGVFVTCANGKHFLDDALSDDSWNLIGLTLPPGDAVAAADATAQPSNAAAEEAA